MTDAIYGRSSSPGDVTLSVVIPAFNVETWVDETLGSILRQDVDHMEVIVVDDGSTDGTLDALQRWTMNDSRITVISSGGVGGGTARNIGIDRARGRYLVFSDADDIVPRGAYARMTAQLESTGSDMAAGRFLKFSAARTWDPTQNWPVYKELLERTTLRDSPALIRGRACWNKMFRLDFWRKANLEFPDAPRSNDIFPMTAAMNRATSIDVVPEVVYLYRERPGVRSMTAQAASFAGVLSYLQQELRCAIELGLEDESSIGRTYSRLLFDADLWVHLLRLVSAQDPASHAEAVSEDDQNLADLVNRLFDEVPAAHYPRFRPEQVAVYDLVRQGRVKYLAGLNDRASVGREDTRGDLRHLVREWEAALRLAEIHEGLRHLPDRFVTDRLIGPMGTIVDSGDLDLGARWSVAASALVDERPSEFTGLTDADLSLLTVGDDRERIAHLRRLRAIRPAVAAFAHQRNVFEITLPNLPEQADVSFAARHRDEGKRRELELIETVGGLRRLAVKAAHMPEEGVWRLEMRVRHSGLVVDLPVVCQEIQPGWRINRWNTTIASPIVRAGNQVVIVRRAALPERMARRVAQRGRHLLSRLTVTRP